jgi:hypothetical protein
MKKSHRNDLVSVIFPLCRYLFRPEIPAQRKYDGSIWFVCDMQKPAGKGSSREKEGFIRVLFMKYGLTAKV